MSYAYEPSPKPTWWKELTEKEQIEWYNGYIKALKDVMVYVSVTEYGFSELKTSLEDARRDLLVLSGAYERNTEKEITMLEVQYDDNGDIVMRYEKREEE